MGTKSGFTPHDSGKTWVQQNVPIPKGISADGGSASSRAPVFFTAKEGILPVQFRSDSMVMYFYKTQDGGQTWTPTSKLPLDPQTIDVTWAFADVENGFAISDGKFYSTADDGNTWTESDNQSFGMTRLPSFPNTATGFVINDDSLLKSTDGGKTWTPLTPTLKARTF